MVPGSTTARGLVLEVSGVAERILKYPMVLNETSLLDAGYYCWDNFKLLPLTRWKPGSRSGQSKNPILFRAFTAQADVRRFDEMIHPSIACL